ncbi:hypothetical protein GGX14DRAFT_563790 [Mycena pura]|uniref:Uncharacterized protein n=1 Tax=Mycena pura TaxID=153505 RepID=A0AAD6VI55_9AGAR|nr:hypothetical protein GGX14DRAFT_563790 [Mycena pura]
MHTLRRFFSCSLELASRSSAEGLHVSNVLGRANSVAYSQKRDATRPRITLRALRLTPRARERAAGVEYTVTLRWNPPTSTLDGRCASCYRLAAAIVCANRRSRAQQACQRRRSGAISTSQHTFIHSVARIMLRVPVRWFSETVSTDTPRSTGFVALPVSLSVELAAATAVPWTQLAAAILCLSGDPLSSSKEA